MRAYFLRPPRLFLFLFSVGSRLAPDPPILRDYTPASGRQSVGRGSGQLVRGRDVFGHFAREPVPSADCEANVRMRRRILTEYPENILLGRLEPDARADFPGRREVPL